MAIKDVRQLKKFRVNELKEIMIKWRIVGRSKPKAIMIEKIRADKNWPEIKESISVPIREKKKPSQKQVESRKRFSEMVKKKNKGKVPRAKKMKSSSSFAGGDTPVVKKKSLFSQIDTINENDKKKNKLEEKIEKKIAKVDVKEEEKEEKNEKKEKLKLLLKKIFSQVDKVKEKLDIKRIGLADHIEDIKKIDKEEVFNNEQHANFTTEKGTKRAQFCGPGTKVSLRLLRGDRGLTATDKFCVGHDLDYRRASTTKNISKEKRIDMTQVSDLKLLNDIADDDTDFFINKLKIRFAIGLKGWTESFGVIAKDKFIGKNLPKKELTKFEYSAALVDIINNIEDGKVISKLLAKPKKVIREFLMDLHSKEITQKELEELLK